MKIAETAGDELDQNWSRVSPSDLPETMEGSGVREDRPLTDQAGSTLLGGRYRVRQRIGRGGMADVFAATDERLGRAVAAKVFRFDADPAYRARFDVEARTLAALQHPGLVVLYDAGTATDATGGDVPFLIMELVRGSTLAERLAEGPLSPSDVARLGAQVADTLAYVHRQGIVHRDIKPANILLAAGQPADRVKLADFGIARLVDAQHMTAAGFTLGTASYLSPEQITGGPVTSASDIYTLGLVLLEALTGRVAFPGAGAEAALARLHHGPDVPASLGPDWATLIHAMTDARPAARPNAQAVAGRLGALGGVAASPGSIDQGSIEQARIARRGVAPTLRLNTASHRPARWAQLSRRARIGTAAAAVVVLVAVLLAALLSTRSAPDTALNTAPTSTSGQAPTYPSVGGQLGTDLRQLEGAIG